MVAILKEYKRFMAAGLAVAAVVSPAVPVAAEEVSTAAFTDVTPLYGEAVDYLITHNLSAGLTATQFGVHEDIGRGDAAIILAKALGVLDPAAPSSRFKDVPARGALAVNSLLQAGIAEGKTATHFGFSDLLTRGEVALMLADAYNLTSDSENVPFTDVNNRYQEAVAGLLAHGITEGKTSTRFGTDDSITRGEFAVFIHRAEMLGKVSDTALNVAAITETGVTVLLKKAVDARTEVAVKVINPDGRRIAVEPVGVAEGTEVQTFDFKVPLAGPVTGVWTVDGIVFDTGAAAAVRAVNEAGTAAELDVALRNQWFARYHADWLDAYRSALAGNESDAEQIQRVIDKINSQRVLAAYESAITGLEVLEIKAARLLVESFMPADEEQRAMIHALAVQAALAAIHVSSSENTLEAALASLADLAPEFDYEQVNTEMLPEYLEMLGGQGISEVETVSLAVATVNAEAETEAVAWIAAVTETTTKSELFERLQILADRSAYTPSDFDLEEVELELLDAYLNAFLNADPEIAADVMAIIWQVNDEH